MRRRFAIPLIAAVGIAPWLWFYPDLPPADQPARFISKLTIDSAADWMGGFSGFDLDATGRNFHMVSDRGYLARGTIERSAGQLTGMAFTDMLPILDHEGKERKFPFTDAEGVALDSAGRTFVSFEHAHRILAYDEWGSPARWPSYTRAWRALSNNQGMEALAIDAKGTLFAMPERVNLGAFEALIYRKKQNEPWEQAFTMPVDSWFFPVGADIGPDGRFYVLERSIYPFGFISRVRSMRINENGFDDIETVLHTHLATHGNLEGLSVWQDDEGIIRLTMVSDDNYYPFMRGEIVEYVVTQRVAIPKE